MSWGGRQAQGLLAHVMAIYGWTCHLCGKPIVPGEHSADHVVPRSHGGSNSIENLRPAHRRCNSSRGAKLLSDPRAKPKDNTEFFK